MQRWLKIGAAVLFAVFALWILLAVVSFVIGVVTTLLYYAAILTVFVLLAYGAYAILSNVGGGGSTGGERERERIYE